MTNWFKLIVEMGLVGLLVWFGFISYNWIKINGVSDSNSIIAIGTIVYAVFTFFMFWNMKSSSETQIRPFLTTSLNETMDLAIFNKIKQNTATNVNIKIKAIPLNEEVFSSKVKLFFHKYIWRTAWTPFEYLKSFRQEIDIIDENPVHIDLGKYLMKKLPLGKEYTDYGDCVVKGKTKKEKLAFKLLINISYDSLLNVNYDLDETYIIQVNDEGTSAQRI